MKVNKFYINWLKVMGVLILILGYVFCLLSSFGEMLKVNGTPYFLFPYFFTTVSYGTIFFTVTGVIAWNKTFNNPL